MSNPKKIILSTCIAIVVVITIGISLVELQKNSRNPSIERIVVPPEKMDIKLSMDDLPSIPENIVPPIISAQAAIAIDVHSAVILFEKNLDAQLMPASTTKIMTALVALDEYGLDEIITVKDEQYSIGNKSDLIAGEKITVENVLKALLIGSGNDAALALGQHHPKGYNHFIDLMNKKAQKLSLKNARYSNVSGVEQENHYASARNLGELAKEAMKNPIIKSIVATKSEEIVSIDGKITHQLENTNPLLGKVAGVDGIKTGWTTLAGECLVTHVNRGGKEIIVVVLGSKDRSGESQQIIEWVYANAIWTAFPKEVIQPLPVPKQSQQPES